MSGKRRVNTEVSAPAPIGAPAPHLEPWFLSGYLELLKKDSALKAPGRQKKEAETISFLVPTERHLSISNPLVHTFSALAIVWLQYQWALEIAAPLCGTTSTEVAQSAPAGGRRRGRQPDNISEARALALRLCHVQLGAPKSLLALVAEISEASVGAAIEKIKKKLQMSGIKPNKNQAIEIVQTRMARFISINETAKPRISRKKKSRKQKAILDLDELNRRLDYNADKSFHALPEDVRLSLKGLGTDAARWNKMQTNSGPKLRFSATEEMLQRLRDEDPKRTDLPRLTDLRAKSSHSPPNARRPSLGDRLEELYKKISELHQKRFEQLSQPLRDEMEIYGIEAREWRMLIHPVRSSFAAAATSAIRRRMAANSKRRAESTREKRV